MKIFWDLLWNHLVTSTIVILGLGFGIASYWTFNCEVNIKWIVTLSLVFITIILSQFKVIWQLMNIKQLTPAKPCTPIQYRKEDKILLVRNNQNMTHNGIVGIYKLDNKIEVLAAVGTVHHIQEGFTQIKILKTINKADEEHLGFDRYIIKQSLPFDFYIKYIDKVNITEKEQRLTNKPKSIQARKLDNRRQINDI